jgi:DNA helicase-2/ATP-dependent DNA helicase PcrA
LQLGVLANTLIWCFLLMEFHPRLIEDLNPQQAEAVTHHGSPLLIVAGAGSGKTRVITYRIAWLAREIGIPLWQILAVTFTNKAAREMRERVCRLLGVADDPTLSIGTFHSRCAAMLRRDSEAAGLDRNFVILDDRDQVAAIKKAMEAADVDLRTVKPGQAQHFINLAKMRLLTPEDCKREFTSEDIPYSDIYAAYEEILERNRSLDFEDLICRTVRLLRDKPEARERWNSRYRYLLVDEFQDTNLSQFELVKLLAGPDRQVCVVGDEDQSIYSWRGADVQNLLQFQDTFEGTHLVRLEQNYRSVGNVLKAAHSVIAHNTMRIGKKLWTEKEQGDQLRAICGRDEGDEADQVAAHIHGLLHTENVPLEEIAIFYRSHSLARALEDGMRRARIPYRIVGAVRFYDRAEIKDILALLRLAINPRNDLAFSRVVNVPSRGIGDKTQGDLAREAIRRNESLYDTACALQQGDQFKGKARKGMEAFLAGIARWAELARTAPASKVLEAVLQDTEYKTAGVGDADSIEGRARIDNIEEFEAVVAEYEATNTDHSLTGFLEEMSLDAQREEKDDSPRVSLMTVHNAKGLEFDAVFIVGLEQGVFPNSRTFTSPPEFEEERRLFYVALTRARRRLYLCRAMRRMRSGLFEDTEPSSFLYELDEDVMSENDRRRLGISSAALPTNSSWSRDSDNAYARRDAAPGMRPTRAFGQYASRTFANTGRSKFDVGDRVEHRVLGTGTVTERGGAIGRERIHVEFDDGRSQEFVVAYAPLQKIAP